MWRRFLVTSWLVILVSLVSLVASPLQAQTLSTMTLEELATFDGQDGRKAYFAYEGQIYDVTGSPLWEAGKHFGLQAGQDLTGQLEGAPHGTEVFTSFPVVATLETGAVPTQTISPTPSPAQVQAQTAPQTTERKWYEGRIRILGLSILAWTGILLAVSFVGNFATCFALPWTKLPLPWHGQRPGPDPLDKAQTRARWGNIHKYFAWLTVIFGILHGVIGLMQLLGYYL